MITEKEQDLTSNWDEEPVQEDVDIEQIAEDGDEDDGLDYPADEGEEEPY